MRGIICVAMHFVPADATIAELEKKAEECENKAKQEAEPLASQLTEEAKAFRAWAVSQRNVDRYCQNPIPTGSECVGKGESRNTRQPN
jgi:hypothetical protein